MNNRAVYAGIDRFRVIAAVLVIAIHTSPLAAADSTADFILTRVVARVAVPFFFMTSGFFLFRHGPDTGRLGSFLKKTGILYGIAILLYLPLNIYNGSAMIWVLLPNLLRSLFVDGNFYHLWYLPASMLGAVVAWGLLRSAKRNGALIISLVLFAIGLLGDSYHGLTNEIPALKAFYETLFTLSGYSRTGLFFAPLFFILGARISESSKCFGLKESITGLGVSLILMTTEGLWLSAIGIQRHDSMYIMLPLCVVFLFNSLLLWNASAVKHSRLYSMVIYIIHPMMIVCMRRLSDSIGVPLLVDNSVVHFAAVTIGSTAAAIALVSCYQKIRARCSPVRKSGTDRAWAEISLDNLCHNARAMQQILPEECSIMAVVKANAYGHGAVEVSRALGHMGIRAFAVATVDEGISLRENGIQGVILILGYTDPQRAAALARYRLSQTVLDARYAAALSGAGKRVHVHIKIDTGMHRLGESSDNRAQIADIFRHERLVVDGIFTHLCASDSLKEADVNMTKRQIGRFFCLLDQLKTEQVKIPKIHILSSYGALNYSNTPADYARLGLALYGAATDGIQADIVLRPVLSLKSRVVLIRTVAAGEGVGYGCAHIAQRDTRVAVLSIGYADGLPRSLGNGRGCVLLNGRRAPIIGSICMDQMMADVTDIPEVKHGDVATLIGCDGEAQILAEEIAARTNTITNEVLSRLGNRLKRVFVCCNH